MVSGHKEGAKQAFLTLLQNLLHIQKKTTPANANDNDFRKNQQLVLDNKALFMPNGNWVIGEMEEFGKQTDSSGFTAWLLKEGGERALHILRADLDAGRSKRAGSRKEFIAYLYSG